MSEHPTTITAFELPTELASQYTFDAVLPDGWMCRNLLVKDAQGTRYALRMLREDWCARTSRTGRTAALHDAWAMAAHVRHPRVLSVRACGTITLGRVVSAWQLVKCTEARTLSSLVEEAALSPSEAAALLLQVVDILEDCAAAGPHLGLSPDNLFVDMRDKPTVYLSDYGTLGPLARHVTSFALEAPERSAWLAPEQLCGKPHGAQTDMWQLGALLRYALTGASPIEHARHEPVHANTRELLRWLMHPDPRSRPHAFSAVREQLDVIASESAFDALSSLITLNLTRDDLQEFEPRAERYAKVLFVASLAFLAGSIATWFMP